MNQMIPTKSIRNTVKLGYNELGYNELPFITNSNASLVWFKVIPAVSILVITNKISVITNKILVIINKILEK
jgi:hypothetical protein